MNVLHLLFSPWRRPRKLTFSASIKADFPVGPLTAAAIASWNSILNTKEQKKEFHLLSLRVLLTPICHETWGSTWGPEPSSGEWPTLNPDGSGSLPASEVSVTHAFSLRRVGLHRAAAAGRSVIQQERVMKCSGLSVPCWAQEPPDIPL